MLTTTRFSRRRLLGGVATVSLLGTLGLGLTVSGSEAAAAITDTVTERIEAVQAVAPPAVPPAPATPATPPAAGAPKTVKRIVIVKDGKTTTYEGAAADAYAAANDLPLPPTPPLAPLPPGAAGRDGPRVAFLTRKGPGFAVTAPNVSEGTCRDDEGARDDLMVSREEKGKRVTVICRNRFDARMGERSARAAERQAAFAERNAKFMEEHAERMAENAERMAMNSTAIARGSLARARATIAADRNLTAEQRREALEGVDKAIAELNDPANK